MTFSSLDKIAFVGALVVFALLYGIASEAFGWFPSSLVQRAWNQAEAVSPLSTTMFTGQRKFPRWTTTKVYDRTGTRIEDSDAIQDGLTLITGHWKAFNWDNGLKLIDDAGQVAHEWRIPAREIFSDLSEEHVRRDPATSSIHGSYLFPNGDVLVSIEYIGLIRVDACGNVMWTMPIGAHHSVARSDDGSFWISAQTFETPSTTSRQESSRYPGLNPVQWDRIVRVSQTGEVLEDYRVLDFIFDNDLEDHIPASSWHNASDIDNTDITHLNDVEPLPPELADEYPSFGTGDLLISLNHIDLVLVADPESGEVKWHVSQPLIGQHDPDYIGEGWIGVFDNRRDGTDRGRMLGGSRIVAFQPATDSMTVLFPTDQSESFHTDVQGKWQRLKNGNLLLTESRAGRVVEVSPSGHTVWEWVTAQYSESRIPEITEGSRYDLSPSEVASWPCSPKETQ